MELRKKVLGLTALAFATTLGFGVAGINASAAESTQTAKFEMVVGAQVRTADPAGIRFLTDVNEAYKTELAKTYSTETYTWVWGTELTFTDVEENSWTVDAVTEKWLDNDTRWYTTLVGIPDTDYLTEITAESYVKIYDAENTLVDTKTVSNAQTRSIAYSASWALNDGYDQEILYTYTKAIPNTSVELDKESESVFAGTEIQLTATVQPAGYGIAWRSSDESVATVDKNGKVTAVCEGTATITATLGNATDSYELTVTPSQEEQLVKAFNATGKESEEFSLTQGVVENSNFAYGTNSIKSNSPTMFTTLSSEYMGTLFADESVDAITFDIILSVDAKKIAIYTTSDRVTLANNTSTSSTTLNGVTYYTYTITITESDFNTYGKDSNGNYTDMVLRYTNNTAGKTDFFYVDNVKVEYWNENDLVKAFNASGKATETLSYGRDVVENGNFAYGTKDLSSNNSASMFITLSSEYMGQLFADEFVSAITFDVIISIDAKLIGIYTTSVRVTLADSKSTAHKGDKNYVYTLTITRDNYVEYGKDTDMVIRYSGGTKDPDTEVTKSTFFYVDNLALVK